MHENRETSMLPVKAGRSGKVRDPKSGHERDGGVGPGRSTDEACEQREEDLCGVSGGKGLEQGEDTTVQHMPDPEPESMC